MGNLSTKSAPFSVRAQQESCFTSYSLSPPNRSGKSSMPRAPGQPCNLACSTQEESDKKEANDIAWSESGRFP